MWFITFHCIDSSYNVSIRVTLLHYFLCISIDSLPTAELVEFPEIQVLSLYFKNWVFSFYTCISRKNIFCAMWNKILNSLKCALFKTPICLADIPLKTSYYFDSIDIRNKYSRLWSFVKQCDRDEKIRVHGIFLMCKPVVCTRINVHFFSTDKVCYITRVKINMSVPRYTR